MNLGYATYYVEINIGFPSIDSRYGQHIYVTESLLVAVWRLKDLTLYEEIEKQSLNQT